MRRSGVLLPVTSLPSRFGIGTFSKEAYAFVDFLKEAGQKLWQILPLGLLPGKLNAQDWQAALNLMKTHQMIELPGAILNVEDQTPIYIYGTVNIFCSSLAINELVQRYRDDAEEKTTEGEEERETGEEDLYPDVSE